MKIAIDSRILNDTRSGLFTYAEGLLYGLAQVDSANEYMLLFTSLRKSASQMPGPLQINFIKKVLPIPDRIFPTKEMILNKILLPTFLRLHKCKVFHAPAGHSLPKTREVCKVLTVHDLRSAMIQDNVQPQNLSSYRKAVHQADMCIAVSHNTKKDLIQQFSLPPEKIQVIYEGVDEKLRPIDDQKSLNYIRKKYKLYHKYFFCLGGVPRKNIERLIRAFNIFRYKNDFDIVIGGAGTDGPWTSRYHELAKETGITSNVKFIGYIDDHDLPLLYNASECFVFPSLYEGFGLPILEAMRCGVPVITSNTSSLPEIGGEAAFYVDPLSEESIAQAMEKVVEDDYLRQTLIMNGLERSKHFSWQKMARQILSLYDGVTA